MYSFGGSPQSLKCEMCLYYLCLWLNVALCLIHPNVRMHRCTLSPTYFHITVIFFLCSVLYKKKIMFANASSIFLSQRETFLFTL